MRPGSETRRPAGLSEQGADLALAQAYGSALLETGDTDIGRLFRDLRRCLRLSLPELARRLETRIDVVEALEASDVSRLPPWPETVRIVSAFTLLAKIDPRPVLHLMRQRIEAGGGPTQSHVRDGEPKAPKRRRKNSDVPGLAEHGLAMSAMAARPLQLVQGAELASRLRTKLSGQALPPWLGAALGGRGRPLLLLTAVAAAAVLLIVAVMPSGTHQASAAGSTGLFGRLVAGVQNYVAVSNATVRDGLKWIEVQDPRTRRTDKLRNAQQ